MTIIIGRYQNPVMQLAYQISLYKSCLPFDLDRGAFYDWGRYIVICKNKTNPKILLNTMLIKRVLCIEALGICPL